MPRPNTLKADFCIAGGGMAGVCAALAAARNGASVVLIQDRSVLGGNASSEVRMHVVGADCSGGKPGARESGIIEELRLEDAFRNPHRSYSLWDLLLYEKVHLEPKITLLLDTVCTGCVTTTRASGLKVIESVEAHRESTEDHFTIEAAFFADCTGDGRLGLEAGADFTMGREDRAAFGETLALEQADRQTLGSSILFTARRHAAPQPFVAPSWVRSFKQSDFVHRAFDGYEYGYWWSEWGGQLDTIKDNAAIRHELLRIALGIWNYIKNSGNHPDSAHWALEWVGAIPGKRESRRFLGRHILTEHDVLKGVTPPDQVAYSGWAIDLHPPSGVDVPEEPPYTPTRFPHLFGIPVGCYCSRNVGNLFMAGRNISATHVAFASTRVMGTCAIGGQAVGTAAALLHGSGKQSHLELTAGSPQIHALQQRLLRDDAFLPGIVSEDETDLVRTAVIRSPDSAPGMECRSLTDGVTRRLKAAWGTWASDSAHHFESAGLPASIEITLARESRIRTIEITFDSGFERPLAITPSDWFTARMTRGPQPELVRDYRIRVDGQVVIEEVGNFLRKRAHRLKETVTGSVIRIELLATHGLPVARVFEVRAYG
ncbi:MAG: FAD-dependent oxidoreductase [Opitutaceae bacterium]